MAVFCVVVATRFYGDCLSGASSNAEAYVESGDYFAPFVVLVLVPQLFEPLVGIVNWEFTALVISLDVFVAGPADCNQGVLVNSFASQRFVVVATVMDLGCRRWAGETGVSGTVENLLADRCPERRAEIFDVRTESKTL